VKQRAAGAAQELGTHLAAALERIEANVRGAREGRDPEFLHQVRVGLRRLRASLGAFRVLPGGRERRRIGRSARRLARALGTVRDWDVLIARLAAAPGAEAVVMRARRARAEAQRELRRVLSSKAWRKFLARAGAHKPARERPETPLVELGRNAMQRAWRKARKRARRTEWRSADQRHALRIRLKRLRYTCEIFAARFPPDAASAYIGRLKRLQDILGELNDIRTSRRLLRREGLLGRGLRRSLAAREEALVSRLGPAWRAFEAQAPFWQPRGRTPRPTATRAGRAERRARPHVGGRRPRIPGVRRGQGARARRK